jgi:hypothetical protein
MSVRNAAYETQSYQIQGDKSTFPDRSPRQPPTDLRPNEIARMRKPDGPPKTKEKSQENPPQGLDSRRATSYSNTNRSAPSPRPKPCTTPPALRRTAPNSCSVSASASFLGGLRVRFRLRPCAAAALSQPATIHRRRALDGRSRRVASRGPSLGHRAPPSEEERRFRGVGVTWAALLCPECPERFVWAKGLRRRFVPGRK